MFSMKMIRTGPTRAILAVLLLPILLAGCNTAAGAGQDLAAAGNAITQSADQSQNY